MKTIKTKENRQSYRRYSKLLTTLYGSPGGYGWLVTHYGYIAGHSWRMPDLKLRASVDIRRDRKNRDSSTGAVLVTTYR